MSINRVNRFEGRDWLVAAMFFVAGFILYTSFRSQLAYHWDSAEFVLAIREYNVALSQPHAPGYFLYVMLGRLVNVFVGDPHASLVWISVVAGAGLAAAMYLLGVAMFGRWVGAAAAAVTLTSPLVWFFSCVALTYVLDAFLVCVLVLWCWRAMRREVLWIDAIGLGAMLAVIGGVRQQSLFGLAPLVLFTLWQSKSRRGSKMVIGSLACVIPVAVWFSAMLAMTGGWGAYSAALKQIAQFHAHKTLVGGGWDALLWNVFFAGLYCLNGTALGALALPFALRTYRDRTALHFLALWLVPVYLLGAVIGYTEAPGHVFTYLPCLLLLCGIGLARMRRRVTAVAVVCGFNLFVFLAWPRAWDKVLWGTIPTARTLRDHDTLIVRTVRLIRQQYKPEETIICHEHGNLFFGLRHFQLYLPEFASYRTDHDEAMVAPAGKPLSRAWNGRLEFVSAIDLSGKNTLLLVVPPGEKIKMFQSSRSRFGIPNPQPVKDSDGTLYVAPLKNPVNCSDVGH